MFHLPKSTYQHVQARGLYQRYMNDKQFRINIRMIGALSFVSIEDTVQAFETLAAHYGDEEQTVLDYFETTYTGKLQRGRRLQPMFPHELCNMNIRVQEDLPRTNNESEGWHTRFSTSFLHYHAHIWKFIENLKQDSSLNYLKMAHEIGAPDPLQWRIYMSTVSFLAQLDSGILCL